MVDTRVPVRTAGSVEAEVDGQRVLLSPKDFSYFGIEGSGAAVWDLIDGQRSLAEIIAELEAKFAGPVPAIEAETMDFIAALIDSGLLEPLG